MILEKKKEEEELEKLLDEIPQVTSRLPVHRHGYHNNYLGHGYHAAAAGVDALLQTTYTNGSGFPIHHHSPYGAGGSANALLSYLGRRQPYVSSGGSSSRTSGTCSPIVFGYSPESGTPVSRHAVDEQNLMDELGLLSGLHAMHVRDARDDPIGPFDLRSAAGSVYAGLFDGPSVLLPDSQRTRPVAPPPPPPPMSQQHFYWNDEYLTEPQLAASPLPFSSPFAAYSKGGGGVVHDEIGNPFPYLNTTTTPVFETFTQSPRNGFDRIGQLSGLYPPVSPRIPVSPPELNSTFPMLGQHLGKLPDDYPQALDLRGGIKTFAVEDSFIIQGKDLHFVANKDHALRKERERLKTDGARHLMKMFGPSSIVPLNCDSLMDHIRGRVYLVTKDQYGCRFLQQKINERKPEFVHMIFQEIIHHVAELMVHPFANYLMQKLFEVCTEEQRMSTIHKLTERPPDLVMISLNQHGTRSVQQLIETLRTPEQISMVISALKPGFLMLIRDHNGNHVIQRCLNCFEHENIKFIFDAAAEHCFDIATQQHGCCVLQRCIGKSRGQHHENLVMQVAENGLSLAQDPFGNYAVQYVMKLGIAKANVTLMSKFTTHFVELSMNKYGSNVVERCLDMWEESRSIIIMELLSTDRFDLLLQHEFANYVIQCALSLSKGLLHDKLVHAIQPHASVLRTSPYCKKIFSKSLFKKCTF